MMRNDIIPLPSGEHAILLEPVLYENELFKILFRSDVIKPQERSAISVNVESAYRYDNVLMFVVTVYYENVLVEAFRGSMNAEPFEMSLPFNIGTKRFNPITGALEGEHNHSQYITLLKKNV